MKSNFQIALWMTCLTAGAQSKPLGPFALTAELVAKALSDSGQPTVGNQVSLPATVVATHPSPALEIVSVESIKDGNQADIRSRVKLACRLPGTCLPFYAVVSRLQAVSSDIAASKPNLDITMRAGTHATLMLDDQRSHIQVAVISLESGVAGKWIRVASRDHKQIYLGEVVSANLLRGTF